MAIPLVTSHDTDHHNNLSGISTLVSYKCALSTITSIKVGATWASQLQSKLVRSKHRHSNPPMLFKMLCLYVSNLYTFLLWTHFFPMKRTTYLCCLSSSLKLSIWETTFSPYCGAYFANTCHAETIQRRSATPRWQFTTCRNDHPFTYPGMYVTFLCDWSSAGELQSTLYKTIAVCLACWLLFAWCTGNIKNLSTRRMLHGTVFQHMLTRQQRTRQTRNGDPLHQTNPFLHVTVPVHCWEWSKKKRACKVISNNKMKLLRKTEDAVTTTKINKVAAKGSVTQLKCGTFFEAIPAFLILVMW